MKTGHLSHIIVLQRHGARANGHFLVNDLFPNGPGPKQLTPKGFAQMEKKGIQFREKYIYKNKILPESIRGNTYKIYVSSSPIKRCLISAKMFLKGLYPDGCDLPNQIMYQNEFFPMNFSQNKINIVSPEIMKDFLYHSHNEELNSKNKELRDRIKETEQYKEKMNKYRKDLFPELTDILNKYLPFEERLDPNEIEFKDFSAINDLIRTINFHKIENNKKIPKFSKELHKKVAKEKAFFIYSYKFGSDELVKIATEPIFSVIRKLLQKEMRNNGVKTVFLSAHDTIIAAVMKKLFSEKEIFKERKIYEIPYASQLIFEIEEQYNREVIKCFMNESSMKFKTFQAFDIPLNKFYDLIA